MSDTSTLPPHLVRLGGTPSVGSYLAKLWDRRQFAWNTAVGELRAQHLNTVLGNAWHLINPLLLIGVYYLVFGVILGTTRGVDNFLAFLAVGIFTFQYTQKSVIGGARSIVNNQGLIRSLQFPRALLPLAAVMRETIAYWSAGVVMLGVVLVTGEGFSFAWLLVIGSFALQVVFNTGMGLLAARLTDGFRDLLNVLPYLFRIAFYLSGILYAVDRYVENPAILRLFLLNPFYVFVSLPREYLMTTFSQEHIDLMWVSATVWAAVAIVVGLLVFRAGEKRYGRG